MSRECNLYSYEGRETTWLLIKRGKFQAETERNNQRLTKVRAELDSHRCHPMAEKVALCQKCGSVPISKQERHCELHLIQDELNKYGPWLTKQVSLIDAELTKFAK